MVLVTSARSSVLPAAFRLLTVAWFASLTADGLRMAALPLLAASISRSPTVVSVVAACTTLPWLLVAIPAGVLVDRLNAVRVIQVAHLVRAAGCVAVFLAVEGHWTSIAVLCGFGFLMTAAETFADGAAQQLVVDLVPDAELETANGRFVMVETIALDLTGPLLGGVAFGFGHALPFAIAAGAFLIAAAVVSFLPPVGRRVVSAEPRTLPLRNLFAQVGDGLRHIRRDEILRVLVLTVGVLSVANAAQDAVLVLFATQSLGLRPTLFATLLVALSIGVIGAGWLAGRLTRRRSSGSVMVLAILVMGGALLVMGIWVTPAVSWACYALLGLGSGTWNVLSASRRQRRTPPGMTARVSSAFRVLAWGLSPVGAILGGELASAIGLPKVFVLSGLTILVLGGVVARRFGNKTDERALTG